VASAHLKAVESAVSEFIQGENTGSAAPAQASAGERKDALYDHRIEPVGITHDWNAFEFFGGGVIAVVANGGKNDAQQAQIWKTANAAGKAMNAHGNGPKVVYIVSPLSGMKGLQMGYFSRTHLDSVEPFNQNNVDELFQKLQGMCGSATSLIWELQGITMQRDPHSWPKFADQMRDDVGFESTQFVELPFDVGSGITRETVMFCVCTHQKAPERQQIVRPDGIRLMKEAEGAVTVLKDGCKKRVFFNERNMSATQKSLRGVMQATDVAIEFEKTDYAVVISNTSEAPLVWILNGARESFFSLQFDTCDSTCSSVQF